MRTLGRSANLMVGLVAVISLGTTARADDIVVPGGGAAIRRVLGLDPDRTNATLLSDVHRRLFVHGDASWQDVEARRRLVEFVEDLAAMRRDLGEPARISLADAKAARRALEFLGLALSGEGKDLDVEPLASPIDRRRQHLLPALGLSVEALRVRLSAGESVSLDTKDERAPLPYGLAAWREIVGESEKALRAENAFVFFVKEVKASRMLVALEALDPATREAARVLPGPRERTGWHLLFDDANAGFTRYPEALRIAKGEFVLPGGDAAQATWSDIVGVSPREKKKFLTELFRADGGKAAYVIASLRPLSPEVADRFVRNPSFPRLYHALERSGSNFEKNLRDSYDFSHLVRFLTFDEKGDPVFPGGAAVWRVALDGGSFPSSEEDLKDLLAKVPKRSGDAAAFLERLLKRDVAGAVVSVPAQKRFLMVSSLVRRRAAFQDPGVIVLLFRGLERFLPLYETLEALPLLDAADVKKALFALHRLDGESPRRADEVRAGLFQASLDLLADLGRAGSLRDEESRLLFTKLVSLPIFASDDPGVSEAVSPFADWLESLLVTLKESERVALLDQAKEEAGRRQRYVTALDERNARVLSSFRRIHPSRSEADEKVRALLAAECPPDDALFGPFPPRYVTERAWLASTFARGGEPAYHAEERAAVVLNEAIAVERQRVRAGADEPARLEGELPETFAYVDPKEPLPILESLGEVTPQPTADDLVRAALAGRRLPVTFRWRGGRYRFDPVKDEIARRRQFTQHQRLGSLEGVRGARRELQALLDAASHGSLAGTKRAALALADVLELDGARSPDPRVEKLEDAAAADLERVAGLRRPAALARVSEHVRSVEAVLAERMLEALLGHFYAAAAGDPTNVYYQDADLVRRHSFRSPFRPTDIRPRESGTGFTIGGALAGLPDVLGLLHADQLVYKPGASIPNEAIRTGLVAPVVRLSVARLEDDTVRFVDSACEATEELARELTTRTEEERRATWERWGRDLVAPSRLQALSELADASRIRDDVRSLLTPSDLFQIGRRLALASPEPGRPLSEAARRARERWNALTTLWGEDGAHLRLAEFGPRPAAYAGRFGLCDAELPPYEELATYRAPAILADRLYDLKIVLARRAADAGLPAVILPLLAAPALDEMLSRASLAFAYDWEALVRDARRLSSGDLERYLDAALRDGRIVREGSAP